MKVFITQMYRLFLLVASVTLFFACTDKLNHEPVPEMSISATIDNQDAGQSFASTKAARTTDFISGDTFGLIIVPLQNSTTDVHNPLRPSGNYRDNVKFTHNGTNFILSDVQNVQYPNNLTKVDVYAVTPHRTSDSDLKNTSKYEMSVLANQATAANIVQSDFMTASTLSKSPDNTPVPLLFKHRLSRVFVNVIRPAIYKELTTISANVTAIRGTKTKALINLFPSVPNDKTDVVADPDATETAITPFNYSSENRIHSFEAILVPQKTSNLQLDFTITTTGDVAHDFTYIHSAEFTFESGKNHTINLKIEDETVFLAGAPSITPWTTVTLPSADASEMAANESFTLTANTNLVAVAKVKVYCALDTYIIVPTYTAATGLTTFKFNGIQNQAPNSYPYIITKIEMLNAANVVLQTVPLAVVVPARTASVITLK